jgi:ribosomal protein S18 acetylase RimI-like enzyme
MNAKLRFRAAREADSLDIACLIDSASRGLAGWFWSTIRQPGESLIEVGRNRIRTVAESPVHYNAWIIAEIDGVIAGGFCGRLIPIPHRRGDAAELPPIFAPVIELEAVAAGSWYLNVLAVHSEHRGRGVGSVLIGKAFETAASAGASEITLIVEGANTGALALYRRSGFVEWERRPYIAFPGSTDAGDWILLRRQAI